MSLSKQARRELEALGCTEPEDFGVVDWQRKKRQLERKYLETG